jgi:hypothetical protein
VGQGLPHTVHHGTTFGLIQYTWKNSHTILVQSLPHRGEGAGISGELPISVFGHFSFSFAREKARACSGQSFCLGRAADNSYFFGIKKWAIIIYSTPNDKFLSKKDMFWCPSGHFSSKKIGHLDMSIPWKTSP